jgi:hypothetical protein
MNGAIMRTQISNKSKLLLSAVFLLAFASSSNAQAGKLELGQLEHLSSKATQTVDVNIDEKLMQLTARFLSAKDPDEARVKELVNGLKGIFVKSFEFEREGEYSPADIQSIRSQLQSPAWSRVININSRKEGSLEVYLMTEGSAVRGLALLAADPKELTIVNIIGPVDLEKLSELEGQFGIPELDIESPKPRKNN